MSRKVKEMIGGCCVCSDECGWNENPLVYCDGAGCNVAVHQACYGIVQVPKGPWYCRKCESQERAARVKCELCPQRAGALKRTDTGGWCHVVCALYIPEAGFSNVQTMEPIVLMGVPTDRFNKTCYICVEQKRDTKATAGACMQCNRNSCKQYFHVTCAQAQGLLCEVTGSYENVKYCGYCSDHYKKLKNHSNVKTIPAFKPIPNENGTPDSSPEKNNQPKKEEESKPSNPPAIQEVKSPQVDQSVSSTSDSLPPPLIPQIKPDPVSRGYSQVSDISSAVSPSAEDLKSPLSVSDHSQEPSSSGVISLTPTLARVSQDGGASSSTENGELDVGDEAANVGPAGDPPIPAEAPRRHRSSSEQSDKATSKRRKSGSLSSTSILQKDGVKKSKKHRESGAASSSTKSASTPTSPPPVSSSVSSALPGHHDYCGSKFGGSPYFQSLSAPGQLSLPVFSTQDSTGVLNGTAPLIPPPKYFPSLLNGAPKQTPDHAQDFPLSMEQLLEQQWEQGAQFLMEQGQHFDISSLLNCLHQLKAENRSLEEQVRELVSRRDHLMAVNARLSLPLALYDSTSSNSKSSSIGSLEDISSPDDVQTPKLGLTSIASVQIPSSSDLMVEDILSPVETDHPSLLASHHRTANDGTRASVPNYSFPDQGYRQPLMYSVVNPPPPSLSIKSSSVSSLHSSSSSSSNSSMLTQVTVSAQQDHSSQMPSLSSLHLSGHITKLPDNT